ncbi:hypothetical protein GJ496_008291 [Pomphorhynchus laevis]|nr:hypothetical protein GJ496_008291 [Pomphorhynchus laevis]
MQRIDSEMQTNNDHLDEKTNERSSDYDTGYSSMQDYKANLDCSSSWRSRTERKVLSKLADHKTITTFFITNDREKLLLSAIENAIQQHSGDKKFSDQLIQSALKLCIKFGQVERNGYLTDYNINAIDNFRQSIYSALQIATTFYEVDFPFKRDNLKNVLRECKQFTHQVVDGQLSIKSHKAIDKIFAYITETDFIDCVFDRNNPIYKYTTIIVPCMKEMVEQYRLI